MLKQSFQLNSVTILLLLISMSVIGQESFYKDYDWKVNPKLHDLQKSELTEHELTLKDKRGIEFLYDANSQLNEYNLTHKIIKVNSDKAIQYNNRIYIPLSNGVEVLKEKARVINSEGKIRELKKEDVKEAIDEGTNRSYRYFAVEGVDLGSEIEYFYLLKKPPSYTGSQLILQSDEIVKNAEVELISPKNLVFDVKSYNGLAEMTKDSSLEERNYLKLAVDHIPKLKQEESAMYAPNLKQLIYKLGGNYYSGDRNVVSYDEAAKALFITIYSNESKKVDRKLNKLIDSMDSILTFNEEKKVRAIENYLKTNFVILDHSAAELSNMESILQSNACNDVGMTKLFAQLLNKLGVSHRIVLTSDRNQLRFDPDYEAYNFLQHYLIYLNDIDKYIAPSSVVHRIGFIPPELMNNYGLFVEPLMVKDGITAIPKVKFIQPPDYTESVDNLSVEVDFGNDFKELDISIRRESKGYYAQYTQPYYDFLNNDQKKDASESLIKNISPDAVIHTIEAKNEGSNLFGLKPFIIESTISSSSFIEKAGSKYLFKVGELIGPQIEMYEEEDRQLGIENDFARKYHRQISFDIPENYRLKNVDDLKMNVTHEQNGDTLMAFISDYTIDEGRVMVDIVEYYKQIKYPVELYAAYREVINAAADFNKISLFLEQK